MLDEIFSSASLLLFASTASFFIADCTSRSWLRIRTRDVWRKLREPKESALHQVRKRCWSWGIHAWPRGFLARSPRSLVLRADSSLLALPNQPPPLTRGTTWFAKLIRPPEDILRS